MLLPRPFNKQSRYLELISVVRTCKGITLCLTNRNKSLEWPIIPVYRFNSVNVIQLQEVFVGVVSNLLQLINCRNLWILHRTVSSVEWTVVQYRRGKYVLSNCQLNRIFCSFKVSLPVHKIPAAFRIHSNGYFFTIFVKILFRIDDDLSISLKVQIN